MERRYFKDIYKYINLKLKRKYFTNGDAINLMLIEKIIYNEKCHLVALFKDYLISDDDFEFFKRYYKYKESFQKLQLFLEYYEKFNILFPNYIILPESKYIYKNIHKKQRMIDKIQDMKIKDNDKEVTKNLEKKNLNEDKNSNIFNSSIYNSLLKGSENGAGSIFGLSRKDNKDEKENISISLLNDIIDNIDSCTRIKKLEKKHSKDKSEYIIQKNNINNNKKMFYKNNIKCNTSNTTKNNTNTNVSTNTNKSNTLKNNNSITENNCILNQDRNVIMDKILSKEKETNIIAHQFNSNILKIMKGRRKKLLNVNLTNRNSFLNIKKKLEITKILSKKNTLKKINSNHKSKVNIKKIGKIKKINSNEKNIVNREKEGKSKKNIRKNIKIFFQNNNTIPLNKQKNSNYNLFNNNKKLLIDIKKCLSENKIKDNIKKIMTRNFINNKLLWINKIDSCFKNSNSTEKSELISYKQKSTNSIFTSSIFIKQKLYNNEKIKNIKKDIILKKRNNYNTITTKNKNHELTATTSRDKNSCSRDKKYMYKKLSSNKKLQISNSFLKKNKQYLKKIMFKKRMKIDKTFNNLSINYNITKTNNSLLHDKQSKKKLFINKKIENTDKTYVNRKFVLRDKILNVINGNNDKNKAIMNIGSNKNLKNKNIKNNNNDTSFNNFSMIIKNKKLIHENHNEKYNTLFNNSLELRKKIFLKKNRQMNSKPKILYKK